MIEIAEHETDPEPVVDDQEGLYLREARRARLLAAHEEISLSRAVHAGAEADTYLEELKKSGEWNAKETQELQAISKMGRAARRSLTESNLLLVISVARKYSYPSPTFTTLDAYQEGNLGLQKAIDKFDPDRGFKFSTYATWWIRQKITRGIQEQSRVVELPVHLQSRLTKINRSARANNLDLDHLSKYDLKLITEDTGLSTDQIQSDLTHAQMALSLDQEIDQVDGDIKTFGDTVADPTLSTQDQALNNVIGPKLQEAMKLAGLTKREKAVISLRFGLGNQVKPLTLEETAKLVCRERAGFNNAGPDEPITRERARQIEKEAMRKLRHPAIKSQLRGLL